MYNRLALCVFLAPQIATVQQRTLQIIPRSADCHFLLLSEIVYFKIQYHRTNCIEYVKLNQCGTECVNLNQGVLITAWSWMRWGFNGKSGHKQKLIKSGFIRWHQWCSLLRPGRPETEKDLIVSSAFIFHLWTHNVSFEPSIPNYFSHPRLSK